MPVPEWRLPARDHEAEASLARELGTSTILAALLRNRGLADPERARAFLDPRLAALEDPLALRDMPAAAARFAAAVRARERIVVYGDYDVDGMTGTVLLLNFIRLAGGCGEPYIPDRLREGYSFSERALERFTTGPDRPALVITVDHGISATEGIARLAAAGVDVIVTDHHEPPAVLPEGAVALINPRRPGCPSRFKSLCGAGVAFKLVWAAAQSLSGQKRVSEEFREYLVEAMALVAMATVADVVPLADENRVLCHHGLRALAVSRNHGIRALVECSNLRHRAIHAVHVGFRLGPRLNAAGRMGIAETAIELLTTDDPGRARELARVLDEANDRRRLIEREMLAEILALPEIRSFDGSHGICLGSRTWHVGVIGVVASRLAERFEVPVLLAALNGDQGRGSARSIDGLHLRDLLEQAAEHLVSYGGHAGAAGCTVTEACFPSFREAFVAASRAALAARAERPARHVDLEIPFRLIQPSLVEELARLAPHGEGNPPASFTTAGVEVVGRPKVMGKDRTHLAFHAREGERVFRVVAFGRSDLEAPLSKPGVRVDLCYRLKFDSYRDPGTIELEAEAVRVC